MFRLFRTKKDKVIKKNDLIPQGVIKSTIPASYLRNFPYNDLEAVKSKHVTYIK